MNRKVEYRDTTGCFYGFWIMVAAIALTVALCLLFPGCRAPKPIVTENRSNTLIERETVDSLIGVAADKARAQIALACDSMGNVYIAEIDMLQGERTRLDIALRAALDALNKQSGTNSQPTAEKPAKPKIVYLDVDCNSDSLQLLVTKLRERITHMEQNKEKETVVVEVVPDYYRNCTRGFWVLLVVLFLLFVWKVADYIPVLSGYKSTITAFFRIGKLFKS